MKHRSAFADTAARLQKPRPRLLDKREAKAKVSAEDRAENAKVKARSRGQCEVMATETHRVGGLAKCLGIYRRCALRASQVHHLISGIGRRNVGRSIRAAHKIQVCDRCHQELHGHVLKPTSEETRYDAVTVRYERVK